MMAHLLSGVSTVGTTAFIDQQGGGGPRWAALLTLPWVSIVGNTFVLKPVDPIYHDEDKGGSL